MKKTRIYRVFALVLCDETTFCQTARFCCLRYKPVLHSRGDSPGDVDPAVCYIHTTVVEKFY